MGPRLEFSLLGTLLVSRDGAAVPIPAGRERVLLAALLLGGGQVLQADELIELLWGLEPPASARASLRNYVKRLRTALGDSGHARIRTQPRGYAISVDTDDLDVSRFEALLRAARVAMRTGSWEQAATRAHAALSLWRGEPLADVASEALAQREVPRLAELRLQALEVRLDACLRLGGHAEAVPELRRLVGVHPLREQLHALLMLALYRSGVQAEALAAYRDARRILFERLGSQPGTRLRELHQQMLSGDPVLAVPAPAPPGDGGTAPAVPRVLPSAVADFTGREDELAALTALLEHADRRAPGTAVISAIGGTAGVGKTALAVHWAHQVASRFPDGQLYVNLRGYDLGSPMPPEDALAGFLRALGVSGRDIPAGVDECAARYRSLLAGRRMLVLLDNARSVEQVRPLLPASPGCMTLVTSRDAMAGLVAREGARRIDLDLLPLADATGLLRTLIGERAAADPGAAEALAEGCSRLPLALRVAAERAVASPTTSLADLVAELTDEQRSLDLLEAEGDQRSAVRAVFSWSYRQLEQPAARAFRLASLHPGPDLDVYSVAALIGGSLEQAAQLLGQLVGASLIQPSGSARRPDGRYTRHDLLRAYARELAIATDPETERRAALTRLFDYYLHAASVATNTLYPPNPDPRPAGPADGDRRPDAPRPANNGNRPDAPRPDAPRPDVPRPATPVPPLDTPAAARAWLDAERASLVAVSAHAARRGWPSHASRLAVTLYRYLDTGGYFAEAVTVHNAGRRAARRVGDRGAIAEALNSLGHADLRQGHYQQAIGRFQKAHAHFRAIGQKSGEARALGNLGIAAMKQGDSQQAARHLELAAALLRQTDDQAGQARVLGNLGILAMQQGRYQQAIDYQQQALIIFRAVGDQSGEAHGLRSLGNINGRQGSYESAADHFRQALSLFRMVGDRSGQAHALTDLGDVDLRRGHFDSAARHHLRSLTLFHETGDLAGQAKALNALGSALLSAGRVADAHARHAEALALGRKLGDPGEQARAHNGLGRAEHALGDLGEARRQWRQALAFYTRIGTPEADQIRSQLAKMTDLPAKSRS
jgi:DNA-binding SARP family transcriptional activator/Flp pilus assembly protein TadD